MKKNFSSIKKSLGQHYLNNPRVLQQIATHITTLPALHSGHPLPLIVEIGSGTGWLTRLLLQKSDTLAIEIEEASAHQMQHYCANITEHNLHVEVANVLTLNMPRLIEQKVTASGTTATPNKNKKTSSKNNAQQNFSTIVCGNLPYNISSRLTIKLLEDFAATEKKSQEKMPAETTTNNPITPLQFVFLLQKEVAEMFAFFRTPEFSFTRLPKINKQRKTSKTQKIGQQNNTFTREEVAPKKKYAASTVSYLSAWHANAKLLLSVAPGSFTPPPKVESSLLRLRPRRLPGKNKHYQVYKYLLNITFSQRRKQSKGLLTKAIESFLTQNNTSNKNKRQKSNSNKNNATPTLQKGIPQHNAWQHIHQKKCALRLEHFLNKKKLQTLRADAWLPYHYALLARYLCRN